MVVEEQEADGGKPCRHETATVASRCELGSNDSAQGIMPANTHAHYEPP